MSQNKTDFINYKTIPLNKIPSNIPVASILVPLLLNKPDNQLHVCLTLRSKSLRSHAGEVCLPGGKKEENDHTFADIATRESFEEIGLHRHKVKIVGYSDMTVSPGGILVQPVIAIVTDPFFSPSINPSEVEKAFTVPLRRFATADQGYHYEDVYHETAQDHLRVHYFDCGKDTVWGLTAQVLIQVAMIVFGLSKHQLPFEYEPQHYWKWVEKRIHQ